MTGQNLERQFERMEKGRLFIIRDDLYELEELQEIFQAARKKKLRIRLLDTGKLGPLEIETLAGIPFSFYTSDSARTDVSELSRLSEILVDKKCRLYYFHEKEIEADHAELFFACFFTSIYISNRQMPRDLYLLKKLSEQISRTGANFVYYHHGNLEESLTGISQKRCWIHVSNEFFGEENEIMISDLLKKVKKNKGKLIVHINRSQSYYFLKFLSDSGAFMIFNTSPSEYAVRVHALETYWLKKKLPDEAFYLYKEAMA
jgi:hypothetical protein